MSKRPNSKKIEHSKGKTSDLTLMKDEERNRNEDSFRFPANILTIVSLFVSALALLSSIRSCQVSRDAYNLAEKQYHGERLLVLSGDFNQKGDEVVLKASDSSLSFWRVSLTSPR